MSRAHFKHLKCFFNWLGNRRPSQSAMGLAALEDLNGFADIPAAVKRDCQSMIATATNIFVMR